MDSELEFKQKVIGIVSDYQQSSAFIQRKLTDTPTDDLMVVNRRFVTGNGTSRPPAPVVGQFFLDTNLTANGKAIWYGPNGWVDATGTLV